MIEPEYFIREFNAKGVDYVLIGGLAAMIHGSGRVTKDIDFAYLATSENRQKICAILNALDPRMPSIAGEHPLRLTPDVLKRHPRLQLLTAKGAIDLLADVDGFKSYGALKNVSETVFLRDRLSVRMLTRAGIIKSKRALGRGKDIEDIRQLEALAEAEAINLSGSLLEASEPEEPKG